MSRPEGGNVAVIAVGGAPEALDARPGALTLQVRSHLFRTENRDQTGDRESETQMETDRNRWRRVASVTDGVIKCKEKMLVNSLVTWKLNSEETS